MNKEKISEDKEIDLIVLAKSLWLKRKFIIKISAIGFVIGVIVAVSIPKEYTTTVTFASEASAVSSTNGVGALAAMAGFNLGSGNADEILSPDLFPDILESTPFITSLFDLQVQDKKQGVDTTLYAYIENERKFPWWEHILGFPSQIIRIFSDKNDIGSDSLSALKLTPEQDAVLYAINSRIEVNVDKKTGVVSLSSTMQSPEISAYVANKIASHLQDYIINYRTQKARQDLIFTETLYNESKANYYAAQQNYAKYIDENMNVVSARYRTTQERLQNEMALAYSVYNQMAQQLQVAKAKVQNTTPVYTVIQPGIVPLLPEKPKKKFIVIGFTLLAMLGASFFITIKNFKSVFK